MHAEGKEEMRTICTQYNQHENKTVVVDDAYIKLPLIITERRSAAYSVGWFVSLLVYEEILLADLCERKILFQLEIYDRLRQATIK